MPKPTQEDLKLLSRVMSDLDEQISPDGADNWSLAGPGSALAADDEMLHPLATSHTIGHCLSMAEDQLRAIRILLTDHTGEHHFSFPMAAHNANIRSALESASLAIWLLSPTDQQERLKRSLRTRQYELTHEHKLYQAITAYVPDDDLGRRKRLAKERQQLMKNHQGQKRLVREAASRAGVALDSLETFPGFGHVVGEASAALGIRSTQGTGLWQAVSGLAHPSALRQINMAEREILAEESDTLHVRFTASTTSVIAGVMAATRHFEGARLFTQLRGTIA